MKNFVLKNWQVIMVCLIVTLAIVISVFIKLMQSKSTCTSDKSSNNISQNKIEDTLLDESALEEGSYQYVSDNGAKIYRFNSIPQIVIDEAKNYIIKNGLDNKELTFVFLNSPYTFSPQYVIDNFLDVYNPTPIADDNIATSKNSIFYIEEVYQKANSSNPICIGYFAINADGIVVESNSLKDVSELSQYAVELDIGVAAIPKARELLGLDTSAKVKPEKSKRFFYDDSDNIVLCYRFQFDDGSEIYLDGITGEIIK